MSLIWLLIGLNLLFVWLIFLCYFQISYKFCSWVLGDLTFPLIELSCLRALITSCLVDSFYWRGFPLSFLFDPCYLIIFFPRNSLSLLNPIFFLSCLISFKFVLSRSSFWILFTSSLCSLNVFIIAILTSLSWMSSKLLLSKYITMGELILEDTYYEKDTITILIKPIKSIIVP